MAIWGEIKQSYKEGSYLTRLLYINVAVFIVVSIAILICTLSAVRTAWIQYVMMPASGWQFLHQPWSIITYMFLHTSIIHLIFNVLALYWFGKFFLNYYSQKQLTSLYIIGGIFGALVYMLGYNVFPYFIPMSGSSYLLGASASVMAILFAPVVTDPNREIRLALIGNIKLKYLGLAFLLIDLLGIGATNPGGSMAHIGGAIAGCIFALMLNKKSVDICSPINTIIGWFSRISFRGMHKPKMTARPGGKATDAEWNQYNNETRKNNNDRIDEILDKIKKSGYAALSEEEKKELFDISHK